MRDDAIMVSTTILAMIHPVLRPCLLTALALLVACASPSHESSGLVPADETLPDAPAVNESIPSASIDSGLETHANLRFDCKTDADCTIKNAGNCCGYYPACVNIDSPTDPEAVARECAAKGLVGICGYPVINSCVCRARHCEPVTGAGDDEVKK